VFRLAAYEDHGHTENTIERGSLRGALHKAVVRPKFPIRPRPLPSLMVKSVTSVFMGMYQRENPGDWRNHWFER